jgi:hypothetical protein
MQAGPLSVAAEVWRKKLVANVRIDIHDRTAAHSALKHLNGSCGHLGQIDHCRRAGKHGRRIDRAASSRDLSRETIRIS